MPNPYIHQSKEYPQSLEKTVETDEENCCYILYKIHFHREYLRDYLKICFLIASIDFVTERYGTQILKLMDYMYQKSGYMRRLIDYFSNMPKLNYYIDKEITDMSFLKVNENTYVF